AAQKQSFRAVTPVFDGAAETEIIQAAIEAGMNKDMKSQLYDGRTGDPLDQKTGVGIMYMLKLHHLVADKIHARATGPYSLITQQPLGAKPAPGASGLAKRKSGRSRPMAAATSLRNWWM